MQHHDHAAHGHAHDHRFDDASRWSQVFDAPSRDTWQQPDVVINALALARNARVADLGAGTGYFATRIARVVPDGRVWALDIEAAMVRHLRERARRDGLANLFAVLATPDDPMLPEAVDVVLVVNTHHHIANRTVYYSNLRRWLRPGGRVVIVDYTLDAVDGPPRAMRVTPEQIDAELRAAGFSRSGDVLLLPRQYVLAYRVREDTAPP